MISVVFYRNKDGEIHGFKCSGHAGYADSGQDIICAAVSMLVINTVNALDELTENSIAVDSDETEGWISLRSKAGGFDADGSLLIGALALGLESVREEYGEEFLRMEDEYA